MDVKTTIRILAVIDFKEGLVIDSVNFESKMLTRDKSNRAAKNTSKAQEKPDKVIKRP
jgi:hypothetical protein